MNKLKIAKNIKKSQAKNLNIKSLALTDTKWKILACLKSLKELVSRIDCFIL